MKFKKRVELLISWFGAGLAFKLGMETGNILTEKIKALKAEQ